MKACTALLFCALTAAISSAQTFHTVASFSGSNGLAPTYEALAQGIDGNFYGTTQNGGANGQGSVFRITPGGTITTLYSFCPVSPSCVDGQFPYGGLVLATNGNFYGTTLNGGASLNGTVFEITSGGKFTSLYSFCSLASCADGKQPWATMVQGIDGNLYGTTYQGGTNPAAGTVFKMTMGGKLTTLYSFCTTDCSDGELPRAPLVQASNGLFYGTNAFAVFSISSSGSFTTLHKFSGTDGTFPYGALVQATNGNFYGTASLGGSGCFGNGCGTVFEITPQGTLTTVHFFDGTDGENPRSSLIQGTDGNIYGTADGGGTFNFGSAFAMDLSGNLTPLYNFCLNNLPCSDGDDPIGGLTQFTSGTFYGTSSGGGASGDGTVFSIATGLGPFVKFLPSGGKGGSQVGILGNKLTGATSVTFNGTPATFTVRSPTLILAQVPAGAKSGTIKVTLPSGTLSSNVPFRVLP